MERCYVLALDQGKVKGNKRYLIVSSEILDLKKDCREAEARHPGGGGAGADDRAEE